MLPGFVYFPQQIRKFSVIISSYMFSISWAPSPSGTTLMQMLIFLMLSRCNFKYPHLLNFVVVVFFLIRCFLLPYFSISVIQSFASSLDIF